MDAFLDHLDVGGEFIESTKLNFHHARCLGWKLRQTSRQVFPASAPEEIGDGISMEAVAVHRCVDAMLEAGAQFAQCHSRAKEFALIAQSARWNPGLRQGSVA